MKRPFATSRLILASSRYSSFRDMPREVAPRSAAVLTTKLRGLLFLEGFAVVLVLEKHFPMLVFWRRALVSYWVSDAREARSVKRAG